MSAAEQERLKKDVEAAEEVDFSGCAFLLLAVITVALLALVGMGAFALWGGK